MSRKCGCLWVQQKGKQSIKYGWLLLSHFQQIEKSVKAKELSKTDKSNQRFNSPDREGEGEGKNYTMEQQEQYKEQINNMLTLMSKSRHKNKNNQYKQSYLYKEGRNYFDDQVLEDELGLIMRSIKANQLFNKLPISNVRKREEIHKISYLEWNCIKPISLNVVNYKVDNNQITPISKSIKTKNHNQKQKNNDYIKKIPIQD